MFNGKIHYLTMAIFDSYVRNYQRVTIEKMRFLIDGFENGDGNMCHEHVNIYYQ